MPTPTKGPRLGGGPAHERLMLSGLATALLAHDRITTTEAKAKRLRPLAERLVTFAKRGDLHARRRVLTVVRDKGVVHRLFTEIAPDMAQRPGGYTRITKIGARKGDNAPMAVIELVREPLSAKQATVKEAEAATTRAARAPVTPTDLPAPAATFEPEVTETAGTGGRGRGHSGRWRPGCCRRECRRCGCRRRGCRDARHRGGRGRRSRRRRARASRPLASVDLTIG